MSKESLQKLNETLIQHFKETGVKNALYYEPLFDYYWEQKDKIGLCNLESYDKEIQGINKISAERILDYWSNAQTIQKSLKIFQEAVISQRYPSIKICILLYLILIPFFSLSLLQN